MLGKARFAHNHTAIIKAAYLVDRQFMKIAMVRIHSSILIYNIHPQKITIPRVRPIRITCSHSFINIFDRSTEGLLEIYIFYKDPQPNSLKDYYKQLSRKTGMKACLILIILVAISHSLRVLPHMHFKQLQFEHFSRPTSHNVQRNSAEHLILIKSPYSENHYYFQKMHSLQSQVKGQSQSSSEGSSEKSSESASYNKSQDNSFGLDSLTDILAFSEDAISTFGTSECKCDISNDGFFELECNQDQECSKSIQSFDDWASEPNDFSEDSLPNFA